MSKPDFVASMLAPCGMNCAVCYKHLGKNPCQGCNAQDDAKPERCRKCAIKSCVEERNVENCRDCDSFGCKQIKNLDKSYRNRYGVSLIENGLWVREHSVAEFMIEQCRIYTCPVCGGVISLHDGDCCECGAQYPLGRRHTAK